MKIGIPKEIKNHEYRVGMTPEAVSQAVSEGHAVTIEKNAGAGIGASDADYKSVGAKIAKNAQEVFANNDMIIKVKEPLAAERQKLRCGQLLFTYLHLAADKTLTTELLNSGAVCIAYETVTSPKGDLPLLAPMSKVAGRLAAQVGAHYLQKSVGGCGKFIGGVAGVLPARVLVIGGGVVGRNASRIALGMGASVTVLDTNTDVMESFVSEFNGQIKTRYSSQANLAEEVARSDVVIGGVLIPGASAPKLVSEKMIKSMRAGSVIIDVAIDQGGCFATSKATSHNDPVYTKHGVIHYCVSNMPGAVPHTSTYALNNVTLPFTLQLAKKGWRQAVQDNPHLLNGLSVVDGKLTCPHTAKSLKIKHTDATHLL